ncbi:MAG TPA: metalloregulator ArsR/SmtB family transcription factor [Gemmatimonadaceae bacterium]|jgi:DNA-binding transcriptional ArsR family regulator|nr:metalloregulator ArsR/SmtB family transcription factor [Gemmatimonadaceae bacterium]
MVYQHQPAPLSTTFAALADPTRREILARLTTGERAISELAARFDMSLPAVSKHVRVLETAGLAAVTRNGRVRHVRLTPAPMRGALEWIEHYRTFWESELELLAAYLEDTAPPTPPSSPEPAWPARRQPKKAKSHRRSKSGARSARRSSASSTRGRKPTN